jgi:hypothetical protein
MTCLDPNFPKPVADLTFEDIDRPEIKSENRDVLTAAELAESFSAQH